MIRQPHSSTRPDTPLPYTTLFRSLMTLYGVTLDREISVHHAPVAATGRPRRGPACLASLSLRLAAGGAIVSLAPALPGLGGALRRTEGSGDRRSAGASRAEIGRAHV